MSNVALTAGRVTVLVVALLLGSLFLLIALLGVGPGVLNNYSSNWNGVGDLITPRIPFIDSWSELGKDNGDGYSGVRISSAAPLPVPRLLGAIGSLLVSLIAIVSSLLVVALAALLLARRSFSRILRWGLVVLGLLVMISASVGPQLDAAAFDIAVQELGYPIVDPMGDGMMTEDSPELISLNLWDGIWVIARFDFTLLLLGAILVILGTLVGDGVRLQRETDGLV